MTNQHSLQEEVKQQMENIRREQPDLETRLKQYRDRRKGYEEAKGQPSRPDGAWQKPTSERRYRA
jgi:hypothetical protein